MTIQITQTCDRCKISRRLDDSKDHYLTLGGWRELQSADHTATVCRDCIAELIVAWRGRGESEAT